MPYTIKRKCFIATLRNFVKCYAKDFSIFIFENIIDLICRVSLEGANSCRSLKLLCPTLSVFNYKYSTTYLTL
jgi:hypothetical protein